MDNLIFEPFRRMTRQNLDLICEIMCAKFDGDHKLDPTLNGANVLIHRASECIIGYKQGAFPIQEVTQFYITTLQLLELCRKRYGIAIVKPMEQAFCTYFSLWHYEGEPLHPPELFAKKLFEAEEKLVSAICTANVKIATLDVKPRTTPKPRKGRRLGERDETLHKVRAEVVAAIRRKHESGGLSWPKSVKSIRLNSAYTARMRGKSDATWIRYAKSGF